MGSSIAESAEEDQEDLAERTVQEVGEGGERGAVLTCGGPVPSKAIENIYIQAQDAQRRAENLEEAKKVVIKPDPSLPSAKMVCCPLYVWVWCWPTRLSVCLCCLLRLRLTTVLVTEE